MCHRLGARRGRKRVSESLDLELRLVVNHHVGGRD